MVGIVVALVVAVPLVLLPVAFIWFINTSGLWTVWKESRARQKRAQRVQAK